jgi:hypothetical protein
MKLNLIESIAVPDAYVSGAAPIEDIGDGMCRVTLYVNQRSLFND